MRLDYIKKIVILTGAVLSVSIVGLTNSRADGADTALLQQIANNTMMIMQYAQTLPAALEQLTTMALAWTGEDKSETTGNMQKSFTALGDLLVADQATQTSSGLIQQLNNDLLGPNVSPTSFPTANDVTYSTVLGQPFFPKDPRKSGGVNPVYNYIRNASGIKTVHIFPAGSFGGSDSDQAKYRSYYNAVMAAESFNAYVLSYQYADGNQYNSAQAGLIGQASSKDWIATVSSENIGTVLRQLLIYQSQAYVLMTQLFQTQKQMVTAQTMTNALLISNNAVNESLLLAKAQGVQPS